MSSSKKTALYARVSTDRQGSGLEAQVRALREFCASRSIPEFEIFTDENVSGAKSSRPGLDAMMARIRLGEFNSVVVYSFSRFARSTRHLLDALDEFQRGSVGFISLTEQVDTSSAIGKALFTIISAISQLERELISERVRNGMANARAKGRRPGRPPRTPTELIRTLAAEGHSYREIARLAHCSLGSISAVLKEERSKRVRSLSR